jgi:tRNA 2-thiouridine synthesizing protein A
MTTPLLDITGDVCPMTFVKVKMGMHSIPPKGKLNVRLKEDALKNVISSLKTEGHRVACVSREGSIFLIEVEKDDEGQNTGFTTQQCLSNTEDECDCRRKPSTRFEP